MRHSLLTSLCICSITLVWGVGSVSALGCTIDNGPVPELAAYQRSVQTQVDAIKKTAIAGCGLTNTPSGGSASIDRLVDTFRSAWAATPFFDNTFLDFRYNITLAANGEARAPVMRDGRIFDRIENTIITPGLESIARTCAVDGTTQSAFEKLILENRAFANIYMQVALGDMPDASGFDTTNPDNMALYNAIINGYNQSATSACKNDSRELEQMIQKLSSTLENVGVKDARSMDNWKKAIALFQGGGTNMSPSEYAATQKRVLADELARQGFSQRASNLIIGNLDCFQRNTAGDTSAEGAAAARQQCLSNPLIGLEQLLLPWKQSIAAAPTVGIQLERKNQLSEMRTDAISVEDVYARLSTLAAPDQAATDAAMNSMINMHISLLTTNTLLEARIPIMQRNCMQAQPGIVGGCKGGN